MYTDDLNKEIFFWIFFFKPLDLFHEKSHKKAEPNRNNFALI